jgi:hypothetical protein
VENFRNFLCWFLWGRPSGLPPSFCSASSDPGTPHADCEIAPVVEHLREMVVRPELRRQCALVVDGTGLGGPVVEMLRSAGLPCEITAVTITGRGRETRSGNLSVSVPKRDLIAGVQVALDNGELRIARSLTELGPLVRELLDMRMTSAMGLGRVRIGADGSGEHDDLVIASRWLAGGRGGGKTESVRSGCSEGKPKSHLKQFMQEEQIREALNHWRAAAVGDANAEHDCSLSVEFLHGKKVFYVEHCVVEPHGLRIKMLGSA